MKIITNVIYSALALLFVGAGLALVQPCAGVSFQFEETGSLAVARDSATAILLTSGQVLVVGGEDSSFQSLADAELYDPANGTWSVTGSLATPRKKHTATLLPNGQVLVSGGLNFSSRGSDFLSSAELYDPATGLWSATGSMAEKRENHSATLLPNGQVLVTGGVNGKGQNRGRTLRTAELYNPATGLWTATGGMADKRESHTAALLPNGQVLVAGGVNGNSYLTSAELYDPATGLWTATGSMAAARENHTATLLSDGQVLVAGGRTTSFLASVELYDPASGTWSPTGSLPLAIWGHTATLLPNGAVLVTGGDSSTIVANAEIYNPKSGTWRSTNSLTIPRFLHTATLLGNGKILIAAGASSPSGGTLASAELGVRIGQ